MPAIYSVDLIEKRDRKNRMNNSIIKGWNVHYQTLEEAEASGQARQSKAPEQDTPDEQPQMEKESELSKAAYNSKTRSYSGNYGKEPVNDEDAKHQIDAILHEKSDVFHAALTEMQAQDGE